MTYWEEVSRNMKAEGWDAIVKLLHELSPGWLNEPGTGIECAEKAIRGLIKSNE